MRRKGEIDGPALQRAKRLRWCHTLIIVALLGNPSAAATAQQGVTETAPAGFFGLQKGCIAAQQQYGARLRRTAEQQAQPGSERYYAILRAGLEGLNEVCRIDGVRDATSRQLPDPGAAASASIRGADRTKPGQAGIERLMRQVQTRVVGGQRVPGAFFREVVAIQATTNKALCTGVMISDTAVLTAAHCVCMLGLDADPTAAKVFVGPKVPNGLQLFTTAAWVWPGTANDTTSSFCARFRRFPSATLFGNDIALLLVTPSTDIIFPVAGGPFIWDAKQIQAYGNKRNLGNAYPLTPARIASPNLYLSSDLGTLSVVGFGIANPLDRIGDIAGVKMYAPIPIASSICGGAGDAQDYKCDPGREIVLVDWVFAKDGRQRDTCRGDSGGPVFAVLDTEYYLVGITSRSVAPNGDCGPGGIYTLVTPRIVAWLREEMGVVLHENERPLQ